MEEHLVGLVSPAKQGGCQPAARRPLAPWIGRGRNPQPLNQKSGHQDDEEQHQQNTVALSDAGLQEPIGLQAIAPSERNQHAANGRQPEQIDGQRHEVEVKWSAQGRDAEIVLKGHEAGRDKEDDKSPGDRTVQQPERGS